MAIVLPNGDEVDSGKIVRELTAAYPMAKPPRVTPTDLARVVAYLRQVTDAVNLEYEKTKAWAQNGGANGQPAVGQHALYELQGIGDELRAWNARMVHYETNIAFALQADPNNGELTAWTIMAPLFFGYFDGPTGTSPQKPPDLATPFGIANQLNALKQWSQDQLGWAGAWRDVVDSAKNVTAGVTDSVVGLVRVLGQTAGAAIKGAGEGLGIGVGTIAIVLVVLWFMFRRKAAEA